MQKTFMIPKDKFEALQSIADLTNTERLLRCLEIFSDSENMLKYSNHPRIIFETAAIKASRPDSDYDIDALIDRLKQHPEVGTPLYGPLVNTVTRGARLKKFYLRSAATGVGKTRSMIADACYIACNKIYDDRFGWIHNGQS